MLIVATIGCHHMFLLLRTTKAAAKSVNTLAKHFRNRPKIRADVELVRLLLEQYFETLFWGDIMIVFVMKSK